MEDAKKAVCEIKFTLNFDLGDAPVNAVKTSDDERLTSRGVGRGVRLNPDDLSDK